MPNHIIEFSPEDLKEMIEIYVKDKYHLVPFSTTFVIEEGQYNENPSYFSKVIVLLEEK